MNKLQIGSKVSYGDMANPRKQGIITGSKGANPNMFILGAGMKSAGEMFMVTFSNHISEVSQGIIDGPGGWQVDNEPLATQDEIDSIKMACEVHQSEMAENRKRDQEKIDRDIEKGRVIIESKRPDWAKSVIVAELEIDDCDIMSDYFNTKAVRVILLAWSKHNRDLFSEMRKASLNCDIQEVRELSYAPPDAERREKYSMGAGYYLKKERRYNTGWKIQKRSLSWGMDHLYRAAGKELGFQIPDNSAKNTINKPQSYSKGAQKTLEKMGL